MEFRVQPRAVRILDDDAFGVAVALTLFEEGCGRQAVDITDVTGLQEGGVHGNPRWRRLRHHLGSA
jgi:hypothetical protein